MHWYGTDPQEFISYVSGFYSTFQGSCSVLHVTEFACMVGSYTVNGLDLSVDIVSGFLWRHDP